jgi:hypothetical protein
MTIPTHADLLSILRASPDVRAAAAALLTLPVPVGPSHAKENRPLVKPRRLLQRAAAEALAAADVPLVERPTAWGCLREGAPDVWTLHLRVRVPRGTPGVDGTVIYPSFLLSSLVEEAPDGR